MKAFRRALIIPALAALTVIASGGAASAQTSIQITVTPVRTDGGWIYWLAFLSLALCAPAGDLLDRGVHAVRAAVREGRGRGEGRSGRSRLAGPRPATPDGGRDQSRSCRRGAAAGGRRRGPGRGSSGRLPLLPQHLRRPPRPHQPPHRQPRQPQRRRPPAAPAASTAPAARRRRRRSTPTSPWTRRSSTRRSKSSSRPGRIVGSPRARRSGRR